MKRQKLLIFLTASIIQRLIPLIALPLFTRILGPEDFGRTSILASIYVATGIIVTLGQEVSIYRYGPGAIRGVADDTNRLHAAARLVFFMPLAAAGLALIGYLLLSNFLVDMAPYVLTVIGASLASSGNLLAGSHFRLTGREYTWAAFVLVTAIVLTGSKLFFIVAADLGPVGWALGDTVAGAVTFVMGIPSYVWGRRLAATFRGGGGHTRRQVLALGLSAVPGRASQWIMALSDRLFVGIFVGVAAAGQYSLAAQLCSVGAVFVNEMARFVLPHLNAGDNDSDRTSRLLTIFSRHARIVGVVSLCLCIALMVTPYIFGQEFSGAVAIGSWLCLSLVFAGMSQFLGDAVSVAMAKPRLASRAYMYSALASGLLNVILLPYIGVWGAVVSSICSSFIGLALLAAIANSHLDGRLKSARSLWVIGFSICAITTLSVLRST